MLFLFLMIRPAAAVYILALALSSLLLSVYANSYVIEEGAFINRTYKYVTLNKGMRLLLIAREGEEELHLTFNTEKTYNADIKNLHSVLHMTLSIDALHRSLPETANKKVTCRTLDVSGNRVITHGSKKGGTEAMNLNAFINSLYFPTFANHTIEEAIAYFNNEIERERKYERPIFHKLIRDIVYGAPSLPKITLPNNVMKALVVNSFRNNFDFKDLVITYITKKPIEEVLAAIQGHLSPAPIHIPTLQRERLPINYGNTNIHLPSPFLCYGYGSNTMFFAFYTTQSPYSLDHVIGPETCKFLCYNLRVALISRGYALDLDFSILKEGEYTIFCAEVKPLPKGLERPLEIRSILQYALSKDLPLVNRTISNNPEYDQSHLFKNIHYLSPSALFVPIIDLSEALDVVGREIYNPDNWIVTTFNPAIQVQAPMPLQGRVDEDFNVLVFLMDARKAAKPAENCPIVCKSASEIGMFSPPPLSINQDAAARDIQETFYRCTGDVFFKDMALDRSSVASRDNVPNHTVSITDGVRGVFYNSRAKGSENPYVLVSMDLGDTRSDIKKYAALLLYHTVCLQEFNRIMAKDLITSCLLEVSQSITLNSLSFQITGEQYFIPVFVRRLLYLYSKKSFTIDEDKLQNARIALTAALTKRLTDHSARHPVLVVEHALEVASGYSPLSLLHAINNTASGEIQVVQLPIKLFVVGVGHLTDAVELYKDCPAMDVGQHSLPSRISTSASLSFRREGERNVKRAARIFFVPKGSSELENNTKNVMIRMYAAVVIDLADGLISPLYSVITDAFSLHNYIIFCLSVDSLLYSQADTEATLNFLLSSLVKRTGEITEQELTAFKNRMVSEFQCKDKGEANRIGGLEWLYNNVREPISVFSKVVSSVPGVTLHFFQEFITELLATSPVITLSG